MSDIRATAMAKKPKTEAHRVKVHTYLIINLLVLLGPLALSFDKRVAFWRQWKRLALCIPPVSAIYLLWDVVVTERGHWSFNPEYAGSWRLLGLPLGEWLFFIVVPYACLFLYEVAKAYFPRKFHANLFHIRAIGLIGIALLLWGAYLFRSQAYTVLALLSAAAWLALTLLTRPRLLGEIHVLWFFLLSIVAFLLVNGILTGLPIVRYNPRQIWNIRIITIPLEDLFYNISMLGFYLVGYETAGTILRRRGSTK